VAVQDWLSEASRQWPHHTYLESLDEQFTFSQVESLVAGRAGGLREQGVGLGMRVGVLGTTCIETVIAILSVMRAGAVVVPMGTRLTEVELHQQIESSGTSAVIAGDQPRPPVAVPVLDGVARGIAVAGTIHHDREECAVVHTSGTSGPARGVRLSYGNFESSAAGSAAHLRHVATDRWLTVLPVHHVGGLSVIIRSAREGSAVVLRDHFSADEVATELSNVSLVSLVPTMLTQVLPLLATAPPRLRAILLGGGPVPGHLLEGAKEAGIAVLPTYGQTEAASQVATCPLDAPNSRALRALKGMEVRIVGVGRKELARDIVGKVEIRGPQVFLGYDGEPARNAIDWHPTGDLGSVDSQGLLTVAGRADSVIVSGGENVHPSEVADALLRAGAHEAAVFGVPDETWGHVVVAAVVTELTVKELENALRLELAGFKIPRRWALVSELPRTPMGKLIRSELPALLDREPDDGQSWRT
jgi:O-succinylbenzoic acid--CoA ligase